MRSRVVFGHGRWFKNPNRVRGISRDFKIKQTYSNAVNQVGTGTVSLLVQVLPFGRQVTDKKN